MPLCAGRRWKTRSLAQANLQKADLREAILRGADLSQADFSNANLEQADLSEANLNGAILNNANLTGVKLDQAKIDSFTSGGVTFKSDSFTPGDLNNVNLLIPNLKEKPPASPNGSNSPPMPSPSR